MSLVELIRRRPWFVADCAPEALAELADSHLSGDAAAIVWMPEAPVDFATMLNLAAALRGRPVFLPITLSHWLPAPSGDGKRLYVVRPASGGEDGAVMPFAVPHRRGAAAPEAAALVRCSLPITDEEVCFDPGLRANYLCARDLAQQLAATGHRCFWYRPNDPWTRGGLRGGLPWSETLAIEHHQRHRRNLAADIAGALGAGDAGREALQRCVSTWHDMLYRLRSNVATSLERTSRGAAVILFACGAEAGSDPLSAVTDPHRLAFSLGGTLVTGAKLNSWSAAFLRTAARYSTVSACVCAPEESVRVVAEGVAPAVVISAADSGGPVREAVALASRIADAAADIKGKAPTPSLAVMSDWRSLLAMPAALQKPYLQSLQALTDSLVASGVVFDILRQDMVTDSTDMTENHGFFRREAHYDGIVVPWPTVFNSVDADVLAGYISSGGRLLMYGPLPAATDRNAYEANIFGEFFSAQLGSVACARQTSGMVCAEPVTMTIEQPVYCFAPPPMVGEPVGEVRWFAGGRAAYADFDLAAVPSLLRMVLTSIGIRLAAEPAVLDADPACRRYGDSIMVPVAGPLTVTWAGQVAQIEEAAAAVVDFSTQPPTINNIASDLKQVRVEGQTEQ